MTLALLGCGVYSVYLSWQLRFTKDIKWPLVVPLIFAVLTSALQLAWMVTRPRSYTWERRTRYMLAQRTVRLATLAYIVYDPSMGPALLEALLDKAAAMGPFAAAVRGCVVCSLALLPLIHSTTYWLPLSYSWPYLAASAYLLLRHLDTATSLMLHPALLPGTEQLSRWVCEVLHLLLMAGLPQANAPLCRYITARWMVAYAGLFLGLVVPTFFLHYPHGWEAHILRESRRAAWGGAPEPPGMLAMVLPVLLVLLPMVTGLGVLLALVLCLVL